MKTAFDYMKRAFGCMKFAFDYMKRSFGYMKIGFGYMKEAFGCMKIAFGYMKRGFDYMKMPFGNMKIFLECLKGGVFGGNWGVLMVFEAFEISLVPFFIKRNQKIVCSNAPREQTGLAQYSL